MKIALSAMVLLIAFAFGTTEKSAPAVHYYFCTSRPIKVSNSKQLILYTPVKEIIANEGEITSLAKIWCDTITERRGGPYLGTSDLNHYGDKQAADTELQRFRAYYADTVKYDVRPIAFTIRP
jgi:hypothetical protein